MPVLFHRSKHQGNISGMTQFKVTVCIHAFPRSSGRVHARQVKGRRIQTTEGGIPGCRPPRLSRPHQGQRCSSSSYSPRRTSTIPGLSSDQGLIVFTHPWSFRARTSDLRHLKTRRRKKMVVTQRKRVKPSLQDARRKIPEAPAPRITGHRLRMTD